jgi:hypothetical protein
MEFEQSALMFEVNQILADGPKPVQNNLSAQILVNTTGVTVNPMKILSVDLKRNYLDSYSDELIVEMMIPAGQYAKLIYPYKNNLDISLTYTPLNETGDTTNTSRSPQSETYTATLIDTGSPALEQNGFNAPTQYNLDMTNMTSVKFQLVNKALEQMRMIDVGQNFRGATVDDAIKTVLTLASQTTTVNGQRTVQGVTMAKSANQTPRENIMIPHGVKLVDVPQYIQKHCGGVYAAAMGYYLQGNQWHVYPALDTTKFNQSQNTLTIINLPQNKFTNVERTYRQSGGNLVVLATGNVKFRDPSNQHQLNMGNGIRFSDATKFMGNFALLGDNKALVSRGDNNNEFIGVQRPNGNNKVHRSSNPINANSLEEYSKLARAMGSTITLEWQHSNPDLITPGLAVQILYLDEDQIQTLTGIVVGAHHYTHQMGQGFAVMRYGTSTALSIFVQPADQSSTTPNSTP